MNEIPGIIKKFVIGKTECYLKIGIEDGKPVYLDLTISKDGNENRAYEVLFELATEAIQHGLPLENIIKVLIGHKFEPMGFIVDDGEGHYYGSICDYVAKFLRKRFLRN